VPLSLFFQLLSLTFALTLSGLNIIPRHFVGAFVFNNVTSLPLLLLSSLGSTSALDSLGKGEEVLKRGEVYFLINALVSPSLTMSA
jgi:ABC-type microcin C transport system permease subunit YejE